MSERYAGELEDALALVDRLRAELAEANKVRNDIARLLDGVLSRSDQGAFQALRAERDKAEAAIARVRALCADDPTFGGLYRVLRIRAILDGAE